MQDQLEREGRSKWFLRLFNAFDKPSESELFKYEEAANLTKENILGMGDIVRATEILDDLEILKNKYQTYYPVSASQPPVLMTHHPLPDDQMKVNILTPKPDSLKHSPTYQPQPSLIMECDNRASPRPLNYDPDSADPGPPAPLPTGNSNDMHLFSCLTNRINTECVTLLKYLTIF